MKLHSQVIGAGPPVVLTTGIGQSSSVWKSLADVLSNRFLVLRWDHRGHGRSTSTDNPADYSAHLAVADLISMIGGTGGSEENKAVLIGHSLGGYLSLRATLEVPQLVKALILIATGPGFRDATAREKWNEYARFISMDTGVHPEARRLSFHTDGLVMERLSSITVPTLVIVGSEDKRFIGAKNYLISKMPHAAGIEIYGAKHAVHTTHAAEVNDAICRFLADLPI